MPFKFPFTNYHELNLDWIIKKIEEITKIFEESSETITIYEDRLADAEQDAADALAAAGSAVNTATQADTAASAASAAASAASAAAAQAQTRAGQAEAAAGAAQQTANAAQIAASNAESIVQNFVVTPSNFTIEPNIYTVTYDPNDSSISPASIVFYSYVFVGGVKGPYTAAKLTAYAVHNGLTMPASQVDALDASSLTFPVPAYLDKDDYIVVKAYKSPEAWVYQEVAFLTVPVIADGSSYDADNKADVIISSADGTIASFPDGMAAPIKDITINIEPVQSGTGDPSPNNVRPISGRTGCNIYRTGLNAAEGTTFTQGAIAQNGNITQSAYRVYSGFMDVSAGTYKIICNPDFSNVVRVYDTSEAIITTEGDGATWNENGRTITFDGARKIRVMLSKNLGAQTAIVPSEVQQFFVILNSTYDAYPITFPDAAGTVYGGTLKINEDGTGLLAVDRVCKLLRIARNLSGTYQGSIIYNSASEETSDANFAKPITCNRLKYAGTYPTNNPEWQYGACINDNFTSFNLWLKNGAFADLAEATAWLEANDTQLCYYLAFPLIYTLTAEQVGAVVTTLYSDNNVWSDAGAVNLNYRADTKLFIERLTMPEEYDMIADTNIASGKFFMVGNDLYLSTAAIAAGAQITVGTNATRLSLADALNQINT